MKFCKNLQKVVELSDQDWAPFWTNYKLLKVRVIVVCRLSSSFEFVLYSDGVSLSNFASCFT